MTKSFFKCVTKCAFIREECIILNSSQNIKKNPEYQLKMFGFTALIKAKNNENVHLFAFSYTSRTKKQENVFKSNLVSRICLILKNQHPAGAFVLPPGLIYISF